MRTAFRAVCFLIALVPLFFGVTQLIDGAGDVSPALDSQYRYMSGLYVAIGFGMLVVAWKAEQASLLATILILAAFMGGVGRLVSLGDVGMPNPRQHTGMYIELSMPILLVWLWALRRKSRM
ncbi:MAG: DUF4345 domain-containing protein [Erythrobacter sp.]|nr:DUF4345 domain-containing protein [Erythrobacter sp.]